MAPQKKIRLVTMRLWFRSLALLSVLSSIAVSCGVGCRRGLDLVLLWLWCRLAAIVPIQPPAWEHQYAMGVALKSKNKQNKNFMHCQMSPGGQKSHLVGNHHCAALTIHIVQNNRGYKG